MRLIDISPVFAAMEQNGMDKCSRQLLEMLPTIDAAPVVRCYQCKYYAKSMVLCHHEDGLSAPDKMDFCSYGERKDGDG